MMLWTKLYAPKSLKNFVGHEKEKKIILDWIKTKKKKILVLYGPTGTGKTCFVHALANEFNLEIIETSFENILESLKQKSFFSKGKLILLDNPGFGEKKVLKIAEKSNWPIILILDEIKPKELRSMKNLRKEALFVKFSPLAVSYTHLTLPTKA